MPLLLFLIIFISSYIVQIQANGDINIKVAQGELVGEWRSLGDRKYGAFEGIPFAVPPLGEKRFMAPKPILPWDGVLNAKSPQNVCSQIYDVKKDDLISFGEEDCLYLNIYSPKPSNNEKLPVIIFIHGGAFMFGSGIFYGCDYLMEKDVVCATFNYRLGAIGFLSTEDEVVPGNNGLKDQVLAMKWIKDNVHNFGGNSDSITILGSSAGGASVTYHTISPLSRGLFHRGASMSGSGCHVWSISTNSKNKAQAIASHLGCPISSSREMIDCLNQKPAIEIARSAKIFMPMLHMPPAPFGPVIEPPGTEGAFLLEHSHESMKKGLSADIPILNSVTLDEGLYPVSIFLQDYKLLDELDKRWEELSPSMFFFNISLSPSEQISASKKIKEAYFHGNPISIDTLRSLIDVFSDRYFLYGLEECTKLQALHHKQPVYFYEFSYSGEGSFSKLLSMSDTNYGVSHVDDLSYIFKTAAFDPRGVSEDRKMMNTMLEMILEFATHGKPKLGSMEWPPSVGDVLTYMNITGPNEFHMTTNKLRTNDVWTTLDV